MQEDTQDKFDVSTRLGADDAAGDPFDSMLRTHLKRELDAHVGSAMLKFDQEIRSVPVRPMRIGAWQSRVRYAVAALLMLGVGVASSLFYGNVGGHKTSDPIANVKTNEPFTDAVQSSWTQTYDQGTVMVDPQTPARMVRRVQYEKTDWKDASGKWQSRIDIPHEDVILVDIPKQ